MEDRICPYCKKVLTNHPYWKHIQENHPKEYESDTGTWIQLYKDYTAMGMDKATSIQVIAELFNKEMAYIESFLKENGVL